MLPDYWITRPRAEIDPATRTGFDRLLTSVFEAGDSSSIPYDLPAPKWQFVCYAAERYDLAWHGSGEPAIALFEPRQANDLNDFGSQKAVYAASDPLWAMFFAIVDRDRFPLSVTNASIRLADEAGQVHGPFYVFSVSQQWLPQQPWRTGTLYLLPRETFEAQPLLPFGPYQVHIAQLASRVPVKPLARLTIAPTDFPFLQQIRGHDDQRLPEYAAALQSGAPWPADSVTTAVIDPVLEIPPLVRQLYAIVKKLEEQFPGRHFTPDGHLVGSIGEVLAAYCFGLKLAPASNAGFDATAPNGWKVEIKATQGGQVALRGETPPQHLLVLTLGRDGDFEVVYNGPGQPVWEKIGKAQSNGQRPITVARLRKLMAGIDPSMRLAQVRGWPMSSQS